MTPSSIKSAPGPAARAAISEPPAPKACGELPSVAAAVVDIIEQAERLVESLSDEQFTATREEVFSASIGAHLRHVLDHNDSFLAGLACATVDYDHRERDAKLETCRRTALAKLAEQRARFEALDGDLLERAVRVACCVAPDSEETPSVASTYGRELSFAVSHAIHHYALIAVISRMLGHRPPAEFGVAPSTLVYRRRQARG